MKVPESFKPEGKDLNGGTKKLLKKPKTKKDDEFEREDIEWKWEFEYDVRKDRLDLYQRGEDNYICRDVYDRIKGQICVPNSKLDLLYPVAQVRIKGSLEDSLLEALEQFQGRFHIDHLDFKYVAKDMRSKIVFKGVIHKSINSRPDPYAKSKSFRGP